MLKTTLLKIKAGSGSTVHVCSQKKLFNFLAVREEGIIKMVDGSFCEDTGTIKVTERDGIVRVWRRFSMSRMHGTT